MGFLKQLFFFAAERSYRFVWGANLSRFCWSSWRFLKSRRRMEAYPSVRGRLGAGAADTYSNDHGLNFFTRLILEKRYVFVIELGSFTADRSIKLSKLFPQTKFYALDITDDFSSERMLDGVTLGPNNLQNIAAIAARHPSTRGLICAHGTLAYYAQQDLAALFKTAAALGFDIAFSEPNVSLAEQSRPRSFARSNGSSYHPYISMLLQAGYELPDGGGQQVRDCWGRYAEERTFIYGRYKSSKN
jgi:hypothetical protein